MSAEITHLPGLKWNAHAALADALNAVDMEEQCLILFYDKDGDLTIRSANQNYKDTLWMLEIAKRRCLDGDL